MPAHQRAVCHELIHDYLVDGVELDFTADQNAFGAAQLADGTAAAVLDAFVAEVVASAEARAAGPQQGERCLVGARVYPTEEINLSQGMDVRQWLRDGGEARVVVSRSAQSKYLHGRASRWGAAETRQHDP